MEYERKINDIDKYNGHVDRSKCNTIITFRTQQLFDLWANEFHGQISDGMWENSRHTNWIWENIYCQLGNETKVEVSSQWIIGRKSFGMSGELWSIIGDRILAESGFATEKEAKAAWREIATAIYNAAPSPAVTELNKKGQAEKQAKIRSQMAGLEADWKAIGANPSNSYASIDFNSRMEKGPDGVERERHSYCFIYKHTDWQNVLRTQIKYNDGSWLVPIGKLAEAFEALKEFDQKMLALRS